MVDSTVYIGKKKKTRIVNLDEKVDGRMLYEIMVQAGPLVSLSIPKIKDSKLHRGYGFAEYTTEDSAEYAVKLFSGLINLYGKRLGFKISGTKNIWAPVTSKEAHGLSHKYPFTPPILKSCVVYCMPFILPNPHLAAHEQKVSSGHLAPSTQMGNAKRKSRFKSKSSTITAIDHFHVNANQPKPKRRATDRCDSFDAIEIQRVTS